MRGEGVGMSRARRVGGSEAQAAPTFGDDDAVGGVAGVEADLDGKVHADVTDVLFEGADVLGALVGDAGDDVAIDEDCGYVRRRGVAGGDEPLGLGDAAVGDAAGEGEEVAAGAFDLVGGGLSAGEDVAGDAGGDRDSEAHGQDVPGGPEEERQMGWNVRKHGSMKVSGEKNSVSQAGAGGRGLRRVP